MGDTTGNLLTGWTISCQWGYLAAVVVSALAVRGVLAGLWTIEAHNDKTRLEVSRCNRFWSRFFSKSPDRRDLDYWHPLALGLLELTAAPVFIFTGAWVPIGGWLTLKTVAQWETWKSSRHTFNRFLIGNALVLFFAYFIARAFLSIPHG